MMPSRRHPHHLLRPPSRRQTQGQATARATGTGTGHRTSTPAPTPSKQDETLDSTPRFPAPRSERTRSETGREERHRPPHSRNETDKQATARRRTASTTRRTGRRNGPTPDPPQRDEQAGRNEQERTDARDRTRTIAKASSRGRPETALQISENAPETDTMEQIRPTTTTREQTRTDQASNRPPHDPRPDLPTSPTPVPLFTPPPDTKNGETRKTERRDGTASKQRNGTTGRDGKRVESTRRRTIRNHGYE